MFPTDEFEKYAVKHRGIASNTLNGYTDLDDPIYHRGRQLNVAQMDVFSRLMMDRIIFWARPSTTRWPTSSRRNCCSWRAWIPKDIQMHASTAPVWSTQGSDLRHHAVHQLRRGHDLHRHGGQHGRGAPVCRGHGKRCGAAACPRHDPPADGRGRGQASDIEITARDPKLKKELYEIISQHSGQDFDKVEKDGDR